ncbi:hypothetical protein LINPERPRIM_LOCUS26549 [Linum perenne]
MCHPSRHKAVKHLIRLESKAKVGRFWTRDSSTCGYNWLHGPALHHPEQTNN